MTALQTPEAIVIEAYRLFTTDPASFLRPPRFNPRDNLAQALVRAADPARTLTPYRRGQVVALLTAYCEFRPSLADVEGWLSDRYATVRGELDGVDYRRRRSEELAKRAKEHAQTMAQAARVETAFQDFLVLTGHNDPRAKPRPTFTVIDGGRS